MTASAVIPASPVDGRFALAAEAKRGGMGTVWKARDLQTGQHVALELLHDTSPEQCRRFVRERQLLEDLAHPGIVAYVSHGVIEQDVPQPPQSASPAAPDVHRNLRREHGERNVL